MGGRKRTIRKRSEGHDDMIADITCSMWSSLKFHNMLCKQKLRNYNFNCVFCLVLVIGESFNTTENLWAYNQPDNWNTGEHCAEWQPNYNQFNDAICTEHLDFICEQ